ncbi:MAG: protein-L-isoaspartate(D-aspartate) O-methyltransferase, partial [Chitinivibrionia bacterium]|nr:protein-L-isoaspartate(D-aspartate) O-methyltransferase [Chitinivibrionia bacterium]
MDYPLARERMVREQLVERGIRDDRIIEIMRRIPRHLFLDREFGPQAYGDFSFPIGFTQTMSQPFMVAYLTECLELKGNEIILEIGTGSGYQAAVLSELSCAVYSIERIPELAAKAAAILSDLNITNVHVKNGDGATGWKEKSPFDRILLTAAAAEVPKTLLKQLRDGGIFVGPVQLEGKGQQVVKLIKQGSKFTITRLREC